LTSLFVSARADQEGEVGGESASPGAQVLTKLRDRLDAEDSPRCCDAGDRGLGIARLGIEIGDDAEILLFDKPVAEGLISSNLSRPLVVTT